MDLRCPECRSAIPLEDVNVANDVALCRKCEENYSYAEVIEQREPVCFDPSRPPRGAWFRQDHRGFEVGASTRSAIAFFLVPFMMVWSGFSIGGIYGTQIVKGKFDIFMSLFGIPFLLGTILFGSIAIMAMCGKILVRVQGNDGVVFTGVGPIGWRRRFKWDEIKSVRRSVKVSSKGARTGQITLEGPEPVMVANGLGAKRFDFMLEALRYVRGQRRF